MGMNIPWVLETKEPYYSMIERGEKILEGRAPDITSKMTNQEMGKNYIAMRDFDTLHIQIVDHSYQRIITIPPLHFIAMNVTRFDTIQEALKRNDYRKLMPDAKSEDEVIKRYLGCLGYEKRIRESGFVIIELKKNGLNSSK